MGTPTGAVMSLPTLAAAWPAPTPGDTWPLTPLCLGSCPAGHFSEAAKQMQEGVHLNQAQILSRLSVRSGSFLVRHG